MKFVLAFFFFFFPFKLGKGEEEIEKMLLCITGR